MEDKQTIELLRSVIEEHSWSKSLDSFKENFSQLLLIDDPTAHDVSTPWGCLMIKILLLRKEMNCMNFDIINKVEESVLYEKSMKLDFLTALILNYHFKASEKLNKVVPKLYFDLLMFHKELKHTECTSALVNICLKILINNNQYLLISNDSEISHQGLYFYYTGFINLVNGDYKQALDDLKNSCILRPSIATEASLIVASLLDGSSYKPRKYKRLFPYIELKKSVEEGNKTIFEHNLMKFEDLFRRDNLFDVIKRLKDKILEHNLKKIKKIYNRIRIEDLARMNLGRDFECSEDGIVTFSQTEDLEYDLPLKIMACKELISKASSLMKYKEIKHLCYEAVVKKQENK